VDSADLEHTISASSSFSLPVMVQRCADESVPAVQQGIKEVVIQHWRTRHGVRTTEKAVPVLILEKPKCGQSSCSKKGQKAHVDPEFPECSRGMDAIINEPKAPQYFDEDVYNTFNMGTSEGTPKKSYARTTSFVDHKN
jgi:hypothetical protein